jgi:hypothetical protein
MEKPSSQLILGSCKIKFTYFQPLARLRTQGLTIAQPWHVVCNIQKRKGESHENQDECKGWHTHCEAVNGGDDSGSCQPQKKFRENARTDQSDKLKLKGKETSHEDQDGCESWSARRLIKHHEKRNSKPDKRAACQWRLSCLSCLTAAWRIRYWLASGWARQGRRLSRV